MCNRQLRVVLPTAGALREGPWRSAQTPGSNQALSLEHLKPEGLYSLREDWIKLHCPK